MQDSSHLHSVRVKQSVVGSMFEKPKLKMNSRGYLVTKDGQLWHRIVCKEFHGRYPSKWIVHHIDGRKLNNESQNLIALPRAFHDAVHREFQRLEDLPGRDWLEFRLKYWVEEKAKQVTPKNEKRPRSVSKRQHRRIKQLRREAMEPIYSAMVAEFVANNPEKVRRFESEPRLK